MLHRHLAHPNRRPVLSSTGFPHRIALCAVLAAASVMGSSCADRGVTTTRMSSGEQSQAQKPTATGVMMVEKDRYGVASVEQIVQHASTHAFISWNGVSAPMGRILLMRRKGDVCAIRFAGFQRKDLPPGFLTDGGPSFHAEYEWYVAAGRIESGRRQVNSKPSWGFWPITGFTRGSPIIKCASLEPLWSYPTTVTFFESGEQRDFGIELAPTNWREPSDMNLTDPQLRWYAYDEKRQPVLVPWEQLPQPKRQ
jgi:hypothetical protein